MPKEPVRQRTKTTRKRRRARRSTEEVLDRIMDAAGDEFEHHGYPGAKTATIARKAGVAEALIFSNFGSKARLFQDSIFKPLNRHFQDFCSTHLLDPEDADQLRAGTREYIQELRQFIGRHSRMFSSLVAAQMYACDDDVQGLSQVAGLHDYFSRAAALNRKRLVGKPRIDPKLLTRVSFATILSCVIFRDWLFPAELASEEEIAAAISDFVMDGLNANGYRKPAARRPIRTHHSMRARV